jgi:hypothetical protein
MNGPVDTSPLNIATTRPVDLITNVSIEVKASMIGVNITPPPTPAITAIMAMATLITKDSTIISTLVNDDPIGVFPTTAAYSTYAYAMIVSNKSNESSGIFVNIRGTTFLLSGDHNRKAAFAILKSGYDMYN